MSVGKAPDVLPDAVRAELERILRSSTFARSERMSQFLRFVVEETLAGRADRLKEYLLGTEVFDRKTSFDPRIDPVVRSEARRLRSKLQGYYEGEGKNDTLRIDLVKGSYAPVLARTAPDRRPAPRPQERTIAVLPFVNMSAEPENEYFSDGLTEDLINALTKVEGLRVVARTSAFQFKGKALDVREIGQHLNVATVLEGSVRRAGLRLRVTSQLISVKDGYHLWSDKFDRDLEDVFAVQDEIVRAIVAALRIEMRGEGESSLVQPGTRSIEAYHLYLKGRYAWHRQTPETLKKSIECFEHALEKDPGYALAYAGLADAFNLIANFGLSPPAAMFARAKAAAKRALEIDGALAEARTPLAAALALGEWEWADAEQEFLQAIALNPGYASAHHAYAMICLVPLGRFEEAVAEMERARELDPLSSFANTSVGVALHYARRFDAAIDQYRQTLEVDPGFGYALFRLGLAYEQVGKDREAIECLEQALPLMGEPSFLTASLGHAFARAGRNREARRILEQLMLRSKRFYVAADELALVHAGLGETAPALDCLETACESRSHWLAWLNVDPRFDSLRAEHRFADIVRRIKLAG